MAFLSSADLDLHAFLTLVEAHKWPDDALIMAFTPVDACLEKFVFNSGDFLSKTEQGRIFSPQGELRWRKLESLIRTVYLGNDLPPAGLIDFSSELDGLTPNHRQLLLWGERSDSKPEWLEQSVPHRFNYPIDTAQYPRGRAVIMVEEWSSDEKIPQFGRYHNIIEVEGVPNASR